MNLSEIRREAREALNGKWGKAVCITLAFLAISFAIGFIQGLVEEDSLLYNIIDLAYLLINVPLSFGLLVSFIKLKRGEEVKAFDYFNEGFSRFKRAWGIYLQTLLKLLLPTILLVVLIVAMTYLIIASTMGAVSASSLFVVTILLVVISIYTMIKSLLYVLAYNVSYDNPELSSKECVVKSAELMKGNRGKYFLLELSFIGWAILAVCTFGIGMLWLMPYMQIAVICFYEKLAKPESAEVTEPVDTKE